MNITANVLLPSVISSIKKTDDKKDLCTRFPDTGPLKIDNFQTFMENSRNNFNEKWLRNEKYTVSIDDFDQLKLLATGSFGQVILVREKETDNYYAAKALDMHHIIKTGQLKNLKVEKKILQSINYPLIMYMVYYFKDNNFIYFVLPYISGGELFYHLKKIGRLKEAHAKFYACQVVLALEYLHYLDFVYRDLKPENILMDQTGYLKLTDFGFCKHLKNRPRTYTLCGTPEYIAPEVLNYAGYGKAVDWWGVGVFIFELVVGDSPFVDEDPLMIYEKITSRDYRFPFKVSTEVKDIVDKFLQIDLSRRLGNLRNGTDDIKKHSWFKAVDWLGILNRKVKAPYKPKNHSQQIESLSHTEDLLKKSSNNNIEDELLLNAFEDF